MVLKKIPLKHLLISWMGILFLFQNSTLATVYDLWTGKPIEPGATNMNSTAGTSSNTPSPYQQQYAQPGQTYIGNPNTLSNDSWLAQQIFKKQPQHSLAAASIRSFSQDEIQALHRAKREREEREAQAKREAEEKEREARFEAEKKIAIEKALTEGAKRIEEENNVARQAREDYFEKERNEELEKVKKESQDHIHALKAAADDFCFPAETPITVPIFNDNNQLIGIGSTQISSIHLGDPVFSCNMSTLTCEISHVRQLFQNHANRLIELSIEGRTIQATPNHPFYVVGRKEWVKAQDLQLGDQLIDTEGNEHPIKAIQAIDGEFKVYNFEVEGHHTYYASGILVHNCNLLKNLDLGAVSTAGCVVTGAACAAGVAATAATGVAVPVTGGASLAELPTVVGATTQACTAAFTTCGIAGTTAFANQAFSSAQGEGGSGETTNDEQLQQRPPSAGDRNFPSEKAARDEALRRHKVSTTKANNFKRQDKYGDNPNLRGTNGEPSEVIKAKDLSDQDVIIQHHKHGHKFQDNGTYKKPHYHGPKGEHLTYDK